MFNELIITLAIIIIGIILLTYAFYQFIYSPKKIPKLLIILLICIHLSMHSLKNLIRLIKEDVLLNKESNISIQKVIIENEDKIELLEKDNGVKEYRVKFKDFFIDFKTYESRENGIIDYRLITNPSKTIKHFHLKYKDIKINKDDIDDDVYKPFKEKYLIIDN